MRGGAVMSQRYETDILVTGGSLEGCIAALELAKSGRKVLVTEQSGSLGGASTNGLEIYLPWEKIKDDRAREYAGRLWQQAGEKEGVAGPLYHDQKAKLVLAGWLKEAGVTVLTHIFLTEAVQKGEEVICRAECKTGTLEIHAKAVIDSTGYYEASVMAGLPWKQKSDRMESAIKWNGIPAEALKSCMKPGYEEGEGYLMGELALEHKRHSRGISYSADAVRCYHSSVFGETVFCAVRAQLPDLSVFTLSAARSGLRIYAYELRDSLRKQAVGFERASIIHAAPLAKLYGIRSVSRRAQDRIFPVSLDEYSNEAAIIRGIETAEEVQSSTGQD